jgi:hypothetical protein
MLDDRIAGALLLVFNVFALFLALKVLRQVRSITVLATTQLNGRPATRAPGSKPSTAHDGCKGDDLSQPLASEEETHVIEAASPVKPPTPRMRIQLLRHLRFLGPRDGMDPAKLAACFAKTQAWKVEHMAHLPAWPAALSPDPETWRWPACAQMPHFAVLAPFVQLGLRCGRACGGNHVKIERVGQLDFAGLEAQVDAMPDWEPKLAEFYCAAARIQHAPLRAPQPALCLTGRSAACRRRRDRVDRVRAGRREPCPRPARWRVRGTDLPNMGMTSS